MTPEDYLAALDEVRRPDVAALDALIREAAPDLECVTTRGMLGYGPFRYRYASGRTGRTPARAGRRRRAARPGRCGPSR